MLQTFLVLAVIAGAIAAIGLTFMAIGLVKSFIGNTPDRLTYLGKATVSAAAALFLILVSVGGIQAIRVVGALSEVLNAGPSYPSEPYEAEPESHVEEDVVEGDDDLESTTSLGFVDPTALTEESAAMTNGNYFPECIESDNAGDFFYDVSGLDGVTPAYLVPISPDEVYVVSDTNQGPAILYINSADYALAGANDVATDYLYLSAPEELGFDPIDTSSEAYIAAEGCVS